MERLSPTDEHHLGWVLGDDMSTVLCAERWWDVTSHTKTVHLLHKDHVAPIR